MTIAVAARASRNARRSTREQDEGYSRTAAVRAAKSRPGRTGRPPRARTPRRGIACFTHRTTPSGIQSFIYLLVDLTNAYYAESISSYCTQASKATPEGRVSRRQGFIPFERLATLGIQVVQLRRLHQRDAVQRRQRHVYAQCWRASHEAGCVAYNIRITLKSSFSILKS